MQETNAVAIEYEGLAATSLRPEQRTRLEAFVEAANATGGLLGVRVFPNFDATSADELPSGLVAIYDMGARVDATLLSDELFQMMAVTKIDTDFLPEEHVLRKTPGGPDAHFASCLKAIEGAVVQQPPKEHTVREALRKPGSNKELGVWAPQLGGRTALAGVYSSARDGDTRVKDYFFVARATLPQYVRDLKRDVATKQPTYRELLYGEAWQDRLHYGKNAARRNVGRIMANLGEACAVELVRHEDLHAQPVDADHAPPDVAVPDWEHCSHSIARIDYKGKPAVAVSYGVVPAAECINDDHFFVVSNPYDGIMRFPISNPEDVKQAIGLPIDTGRSVAPASLVGAKIPVERTRGVTWEGSPGTGGHPDLHESAFRPLGKEFKQAMRQMGWNPEHHPERLVPIAVKIAAPNLQ